MTDDMIPNGGAENRSEPMEQNSANRLSSLIDEEAEAIPYFSLSDIEQLHEPVGSESDATVDDEYDNVYADTAENESDGNGTELDGSESDESNAANDEVNTNADEVNADATQSDKPTASGEQIYETLWQEDEIPCPTDTDPSDETSGENGTATDSTDDEYDYVVIDDSETDDSPRFSTKSQHIAAIVSGNELSITAQRSDGQPTSDSKKSENAETIDSESAAEAADITDTGIPESGADAPKQASTARQAAKEAARQQSEARKRRRAARRDGRRGIDSLFDTVELCVFTLAAVLVVMAFFFRHAVVDGSSMADTLSDNDALIISDFLYTPKAGDIVVVEDYEIYGLNIPLVKRVVAVGGQLVRIQADGVYVDGVREEYYSKSETPTSFNYILNIEYMTMKDPSSSLNILSQYDDFEYVPSIYVEFRVPDGDIFILGDNRDDSADSRYFGCVDEESIIGRVLLRVYPFSVFGTVD